ncbi:MAG: hypothetical protein AAF628_20580 [Planctomycetota bacterium]
MNHKVCDALCLDTQANDGLASDVSQVVDMNGMNAIQAEVVVYANTSSGALTIQPQVSNDGVNWVDHSTSGSITAGDIGRQVLGVVTPVATSYARLYFTLAGTGKVIVDAHLAISKQ